VELLGWTIKLDGLKDEDEEEDEGDPTDSTAAPGLELPELLDGFEEIDVEFTIVPDGFTEVEFDDEIDEVAALTGRTLGVGIFLLPPPTEIGPGCLTGPLLFGLLLLLLGGWGRTCGTCLEGLEEPKWAPGAVAFSFTALFWILIEVLLFLIPRGLNGVSGAEVIGGLGLEPAINPEDCDGLGFSSSLELPSFSFDFLNQ